MRMALLYDSIRRLIDLPGELRRQAYSFVKLGVLFRCCFRFAGAPFALEAD